MLISADFFLISDRCGCFSPCRVQRRVRRSSAEPLPLSGPGLHLSPAAGARLPSTQAIQGELPVSLLSIPLKPSIRLTSLTLSVSQLARTINQVETSWALGATFHYIESLKAH